MLGSTEDAEDVLQEVFVNAYRAMLADEREINLRPWLYRIARNRCLNHLRKPTADSQESMDMVPMVEAGSTAEKVHNREEFRQLLTDVSKLPETQRSALLLREMDAMSYEEIASAMDTSVPSVKSLLVRARISLAEASQARLLTCGEVRLELAEAAEGLRKITGPVRRHVRECDECSDFRSQVRSNDKVLAALFPAGGLLALRSFIAGKLGFGGASGGAGAGAAGASAGTAPQARSAASEPRSAAAARPAASVPSAERSAPKPSPASSPPRSSPAGAVEVKQQVDPSSNQVPPVTRQASRYATTAPAIAHAQPAATAPVALAAPSTAAQTPPPEAQPAPPAAETEQVAPDAVTPADESSAAGSTLTAIDPGEPNSVKPAAPAVTDATAQDGVPPASSGGTVVVTVAGTTHHRRRPPKAPPRRKKPSPAAQRSCCRRSTAAPGGRTLSHAGSENLGLS